MSLPAPPALIAGARVAAGLSWAVVRPDLDFETYSEAGHCWDAAARKWKSLPGATKKGLNVVGAAVYAQHPTTEVLCLWYDLHDGRGPQFWRPGFPLPHDLFACKTIEAWNSGFEWWVWNYVCVPKYGWPPRAIEGMYCAMAKARAHSLPGSLEKAGEVTDAPEQKDPAGSKLLDNYCSPRNPTATDPRTRRYLLWTEEERDREVDALTRLGIKPRAAQALAQEDFDAAHAMSSYCRQDIKSELSVGVRTPDLSRLELPIWRTDQRINRRGVAVDRDGVENCIAVIEQAAARYGQELFQLAGCYPTELAKLTGWMHGRGVHTDSLDDEAVTLMLTKWDLPPDVRRALEIRAAVGSSSVKKVYSMRNCMTAAGRLHDLYLYHAARTGRPTGNGAQPTNLPRSGPNCWKCAACGQYHFVQSGNACPWCNTTFDRDSKRSEWSPGAMESALLALRSRSLAVMERYFSDAMWAVAGVLRGLFVPAPGKKFISSDFSAIEGVVIAALAGEKWRLDVFAGHGKIYEMSAAKILGIPFEEMMAHAGYTDLSKPEWWKAKQTGKHHPARQMPGKVAELGLGFGGWINAWKQFDGPGTDDEIKANILAWREASPAIPEFWGGQYKGDFRNRVPCRFGLEGALLDAIQNPGREFDVLQLEGGETGLTYVYHNDVLYLHSPGGGKITYHRPRIRPADQSWRGLSVSYEGWNSNPKNGPMGWIDLPLYGGRAAENVVQHVARNVQMHGIENLEQADYPIVMHTYDEVVAEVDEGFGSVAELEGLMMDTPEWAKGWPIKAAGGWEGLRYCKA
jgi:DNA polymerase bacteriophage-type